MKGRPALAAITKPPEQRLEIKRTDYIVDETRQMLLREPVIQVRSKQKQLVGIVVAKVVPHNAGRLIYSSFFTDYISKYRPTDKRSVCHLRDRLLGDANLNKISVIFRFLRIP